MPGAHQYGKKEHADEYKKFCVSSIALRISKLDPAFAYWGFSCWFSKIK